MVIYTKYVVDASGGSETMRNIYNNRFTTGVSRDAGTFAFTIDDEKGDYKATFDIGDHVDIYLDRNANPTTKVFGGFITDLAYTSFPSEGQKIVISGKDYNEKLLDTVVNNVYYNRPDYYIFIDIIDSEVNRSKNLSDFGSAAAWVKTAATDADTPTKYTTYFTEGEQSLKFPLIVLQSGQTYGEWTNTSAIGSFKDQTNNGTEGKVGMQIWVDDATLLAAADNFQLRIGSAVGAYIGWNATLTTGWNNLLFDVDDTDVSAGVIDWDAIDYQYMKLTEGAAPADTFIACDNLRVFRKNHITYENLAFDSGYTITQKSFRNRVVKDAFTEIAEDAGYDFRIDKNIDLNYYEEESVSSGAVLDNTNVWKSNHRVSRAEMYNKVRVYGGRYLTGTKETFTANGGSVYQLENKPHNIFLTVGNCPAVVTNAEKNGWFLADRNNAPTDTDFWIDFDNRNLIFSGAPPTSGTECIYCHYDKKVPIAKEAEDNASVDNYNGYKTKIIVNDDITDPRQAKKIVKSQLEELKDPQTMANISIRTKDESWTSLTPGETIIVNLPNENLASTTYKILQITYTLGMLNEKSEEHMSVRLSEVVKDTVDILKDTLEEIRRLKARNADVSDSVTKIKTFAGSVGIRGIKAQARPRFIYDSFVLDDDVNGIIDQVGTMIDSLDVVGNWTGNTGSLNLALSLGSPVLVEGDSSILGVFTGSGYSEVKDSTTAQGDLSDYTGQNAGTPSKGTLGVHLRTSDWDLISGNMKLEFGSDNSNFRGYNAISKGFVPSGTQTTGSYHNGWGYYTFELKDPAVSTGNPDWTNTDYIKFKFEFDKAGSVWFDYLTICSGEFIGLNGLGDRRSAFGYLDALT